MDICTTTKTVDGTLDLMLPSSVGFLTNVIKIDSRNIVAYLFENKTSVMINERDFHVFMLDGLRVDLHTDQPGRLILFRTEEGSILSDTRPASSRCLCDKDPTVLRLQQKQLVIKNLILMHLNLLQEAYSSVEIKTTIRLPASTVS